MRAWHFVKWQLKKAIINSFWQRQTVPWLTIRYTTLNHTAIFYTLSVCPALLCGSSKGDKVMVVNWRAVCSHVKSCRFMYIVVWCCVAQGQASTSSGLVIFFQQHCCGYFLHFYDGFSLMIVCNIKIQNNSSRSSPFFFNKNVLNITKGQSKCKMYHHLLWICSLRIKKKNIYQNNKRLAMLDKHTKCSWIITCCDNDTGKALGSSKSVCFVI